MSSAAPHTGACELVLFWALSPHACTHGPPSTSHAVFGSLATLCYYNLGLAGCFWGPGRNFSVHLNRSRQFFPYPRLSVCGMGGVCGGVVVFYLTHLVTFVFQVTAGHKGLKVALSVHLEVMKGWKESISHTSVAC